MFLTSTSYFHIIWSSKCICQEYSHFWRFGLVLAIKEFRQGSFLYRVNAGTERTTFVENVKSIKDVNLHMNVPIVIKPRCVTRYYDMMGLFCDTVFSLWQARQIPSPLLVFLDKCSSKLILISLKQNWYSLINPLQILTTVKKILPFLGNHPPVHLQEWSECVTNQSANTQNKAKRHQFFMFFNRKVCSRFSMILDVNCR